MSVSEGGRAFAAMWVSVGGWPSQICHAVSEGRWTDAFAAMYVSEAFNAMWMSLKEAFACIM
jgi:hypothetical protein